MSSVGEIHLQALGVDVNVQNSLGQTVLHLAVLHGHAEIVESLLQCGAQRHLLDNSGLTPIMIAVLEVENMERELELTFVSQCDGHHALCVVVDSRPAQQVELAEEGVPFTVRAPN